MWLSSHRIATHHNHHNAMVVMRCDHYMISHDVPDKSPIASRWCVLTQCSPFPNIGKSYHRIASRDVTFITSHHNHSNAMVVMRSLHDIAFNDQSPIASHRIAMVRPDPMKPFPMHWPIIPSHPIPSHHDAMASYDIA